MILQRLSLLKSHRRTISGGTGVGGETPVPRLPPGGVAGGTVVAVVGAPGNGKFKNPPRSINDVLEEMPVPGWPKLV